MSDFTESRAKETIRLAAQELGSGETAECCFCFEVVESAT